jgi:prepilin-type N-terminal cleavage/methylation domain-containing protein
MGFTLVEMAISLVILSVVGLGAYAIIVSVTDSQKKLEKTLERGFNSFSYKRRNIPLQPLRIGMINRLGWMRVASPNAYSNGVLQGDLVNREFGLSIVSDDARLEEPVWVTCLGDKDIRAECSPFLKGKSMLRITLGERARGFAIVRLQAEWPGLPANHPYKRSPEYTYTIPIARDCEFVSQNPQSNDAPKFLLHNGMWQENGPPTNTGCFPTFKTYHCIDGVIKESAGERVCP